MKILYYGGQKSGKSHLAEQKALHLAKETTPYYVATYNDNYDDPEMQARITRHKSQRKERFITIEETEDLTKVIKKKETYLIDCISMLLLNTLEKDTQIVVAQLEEICQTDANIIFVLNDVNSGVIPIDAISRKYVDRSGVIGQKIAALCDEVYEVKLGLEIKLK